jgi:hypothetical protein
MTLQTATNPNTGERVALVDGSWMPITQTATNAQGVKAYLVGGSWVVDDRAAPAAAPAATTAQPAAPAASTAPTAAPVPEPKIDTKPVDQAIKTQAEDTSWESGKGVRSSISGMKTSWEGVKEFFNAGQIEGSAKAIQLYDKIDSGEIKNPNDIRKAALAIGGKDSEWASSILPGYGSMYANASPEKRQEIRDKAKAEIESSKKSFNDSMKLVDQYQEENKKNKGKVEDFTDVKSISDFSDWLAFNVGSGAAQMAPILAAAYVTKAPGVLTVGTGMELGSSTQTRINHIMKEAAKETDPQKRADTIIKYVSDSGDVTLTSALVSGSLDTILGPDAKLIKGPLAETLKTQTKKEIVKQVPKELAKATGGEGLTGGLQEVVQINAERQLGEQTGDIITKDNIKRIVNSATAEAAGGFGGGVAMESGRLAKAAYADTDYAKNREIGQALQQDIDSRNFNRAGIERRANQALDTGIVSEESTARPPLTTDPRILAPQAPEQVAQQPVEQVAAAEPTLVTEETISGMGVGKTNKSLREQILGKDLSDPAQAAEVRTALEAYSSKPKLSESIKEKVTAFLEQPVFQPQPVETPDVITPVEAQQAEAQGAQQAAAAAPAIEQPVAQPVEQAALPTDQVTPAQPTQEFFNPLEATSYADVTDMLGLPEDATEAEVLDMADYLGHDAIVYDTPEGKKTLTVEEPGIDESQYLNVVPDTTGTNIPFTEPVQQQDVKRTPSLKRTIDRLNKALESGQMTPEQHSQAVIDERELDKLRQSRKPVNPRARGARIIREKLLAAARRGEITEDEVDFAEWFIMQNPALVADVGIGIRQAKEGNRGVSGFYNPLARIITLIKKSGSEKTVVHEILHHMERMMPAEVQEAIRKAWEKNFNAARDKAIKGKDENLQTFFQLLTIYHFGSPSEKQMREALKMIIDGKVDAKNYQFVNPSEFWAVNATDVMQNRYNFSDTVINRLKNWLRELAQTIKGMFGLPSDAPIIKALNSLMKADGKFNSNTMLAKESEFYNISPNASQEAKAALNELNAKGLGSAPVEPGLIERAKNSIKNAIDNPRLTAQSAKENTTRFLDKIETAAFSTDAGLNNNIRRSIVESTLSREDMVGALLEISLSQTVHSDAVASNLLQYGEIKYNEELHKWEAIQNDNSFLNLTKQISDLAEKHNITPEEAQLLGHRAFEARRTKGLANFAAEMKAEARSLFNQANKARAAAAEANAAGDVELATRLTAQSRKFAKEAQRFYNIAPTIHLTPEQVKVGMELFNKFPELNQIADTWQGMRENTKNALLESGLWSEEEADKMLANIEYVPFYREEQLEKNKGPKEFLRGLGVQAKEKRLKGSKKAVNNVFDNMARWMQYAAIRSVRNRSALALVDAAVENGMATEVKATERSKPNVVRVWREGNEQFFEMADPLYMDAFTGLESVAIPAFKIASAVSNMLRDTVVLNPIFTVAQIPQDAYSAMFTSGIKTRYALTIPVRAVKEFVLTLGKWSKSHNELRRFGAVGIKDFSSAVDRLNAEVTAGVKAPSGVWGKTKSVLNHIAMSGDNAVRQAVYEATIASGRSQAEAIEKAFQIVNFRNKGSSKTLALAGQVIPFFNAYLAVQHVAYKTITGRGISPEERAEALKTLIATTGAVYVLSTLYAMINGDDEDYMNKPAAIRDRLLMIPGTGGLSIPLRKDWFLIPKVIAEHTYLLLADKGYEDARKFRDSMKSTVMTALLSPTAVPQLVKAPVEISLNHDFFQDRPLITARMKSLETERQFNNGTSELGKIFGKTGIMAPINFDHFVKGYFGSLGGLVLTLTNQVLHSDPNIPRPSLSIREILNSIPGTSGYISKPHESGLKNDFYVLVEECNKAANTMKDIEKRSPSEIREFVKDKTMVRRADMAPEVNKMAAELTSIRKDIDFITNAPESQLTADQKQEKLKKLKDVERKVLERMNIKKLRKIAEL